MIKNAAKVLLAPSMSRAFLVCLIYIAVPLALSVLVPQKIFGILIGNALPIGALLVNVISFMILTPLGYGLTSWYLHLIRKQETKISDLFSWFTDGERLWRGLGLGIVVGVIKTIITGIFGVITAIYPYFKLREADALGFTFDWIFDLNAPIPANEEMFFINTALVTYAIIFAALFIGTMIFFRFSAIKNIHASNYKFGLFKTMRVSARAMRGHYFETLKFHLSFLPWLLFSLFTFGFGLSYAAPYYLASTTLYYEYLLDAHHKLTYPILTLGGARMPDEEAPQPDGFDADLGVMFDESQDISDGSETNKNETDPDSGGETEDGKL